MAVTLKDIADMVGVSINSVSLALKGNPRISAETRQRIQKAAQALGYRPNLNARSLVLKKTSIIGVAVTESDNPVRMEFYEKLNSLLAEDGYRILLVSLKHSWPQENMAAVEELISRRVDGLIIGTFWKETGGFAMSRLLQDCSQNHLPVVLMGHSDSEYGDCVEINLTEAVRKITRHLIDKGYRDIAFSPSPDSLHAEGYRQAMQAGGLEEQISYLGIDAGRSEPAYQAMLAHIRSGRHLPAAVIAPNDLGAIGFLTALRECGIRVPEDCAVVGIDNIQLCRFAYPALTSIGYDNLDCARMAWNLLKRRIENQENGSPVRIPVEYHLVPRKSS